MSNTMSYELTRSGVKELLSEGYGFGGVWSYLMDLCRSNLLTNEDFHKIIEELASGTLKKEEGC